MNWIHCHGDNVLHLGFVFHILKDTDESKVKLYEPQSDTDMVISAMLENKGQYILEY